MDSLRKLFFHSRVSESELTDPRPIALEKSTLGVLPPELINHIAKFLPLHSAAIFTLSCRPIWHILGRGHLKQLQICVEPGNHTQTLSC